MRTTLLLTVLGLVVTACGDDSGAPTTTTPPETATTTTVGHDTTPTTTVVTSVQPPTNTTTTIPTAQPGWDPLPDGPGLRRDAAMAVAPDGTVWLHGGRNSGTPLGDLWRFDAAAGTWTEVETGEGPGPRFGHLAEWDPAGGRLIVATGQRGASEFFDDAWAFDPDTESWSELAPPGSGPSERYGSCSAYDAATNSMILTHGFTVFGRFDDTWALDLATGEWTELSPATPRPEPRCLHACEIDPESGSLVMFGGQSDSTRHLGDTWTLDLTLDEEGWQLIDQGTPGERRFPSLTAAGGRIHLFGGAGRDGRLAAPFALTVGGWQAYEVGAGPEPRDGHAAASTDGTIYVFGGEDADGELSDFWALVVP